MYMKNRMYEAESGEIDVKGWMRRGEKMMD